MKVYKMLFFIMIFFATASAVVAQDNENTRKKQKFSAEEVNRCAQLIEDRKFYQAKKICKKLAKAGQPHAQFNLGKLYYQGSGVMADKRLAFKWIKKSALNNYAKAQYNVAIMLANGQGVKADLTTAYAWILLAQDNGYEEASRVAENMARELTVAEKDKAEQIRQQLKTSMK